MRTPTPAPTLLVPFLIALLALGGCDRGERVQLRPASHPLEARLQAAKVVPDAAQRVLALQELLNEGRGPAETDRTARRVVIEGLRLLAETQQALGEGPAAVATGEHRREELTRLLAQDPGDGFLRGQLAYDRALEGSFSKAWTLLSEGLEKTDAEDFEELALLHFSTAVPVLESLDPTRRDHQQAGRLAHATLLRGLLARAQSRGACLEHRTALLNGLAMAEVMSGDTAAATRTLDAWEVLDPANATIIEMRHQIRTATEPGR